VRECVCVCVCARALAAYLAQIEQVAPYLSVPATTLNDLRVDVLQLLCAFLDGLQCACVV